MTTEGTAFASNHYPVASENEVGGEPSAFSGPLVKFTAALNIAAALEADPNPNILILSGSQRARDVQETKLSKEIEKLNEKLRYKK
jgi:hypothetical protein